MMNHRWQQLVMIGTSSIIIILLSHDHLRQQEEIRQIVESAQLPLVIPSRLLWPKEILSFRDRITELQKDQKKKESLRIKAKKYGLQLDPLATIEEWKETIESEGVQRSLQESAQTFLHRYGMTPYFAPEPLEKKAKRWNLALIGLDYQNIEDLMVMKYELTHASAWFLGHSISEELMTCLFCPITLRFEEAKNLADQLSFMMDLVPCYRDQIPISSCSGWRLPQKTEWEIARGDLDQQWSYLIAISPDDDSEKTSQTTGQTSPNQFGLHDIVGNQVEWLNNGKPIGGDIDGDVTLKEAIGVRFYRKKTYVKP
jgi:hypothetical protein